MRERETELRTRRTRKPGWLPFSLKHGKRWPGNVEYVKGAFERLQVLLLCLASDTICQRNLHIPLFRSLEHPFSLYIYICMK
mgnify:CR=1 FL=1